ncbi:MAG TPA: hypothetical protein VKX39_02470 [Bryobacteraceae bacterium]|nr:hypothetical protein [Bryobacteraceae bacterium]
MRIAEAVEKFLQSSRRPVLFEPGDDPMAVARDSFLLTTRGSVVTLECWNEKKNLVRRLRAIHLEKRGRLELEVERFGAKPGRLTLLDLEDPANHDVARRGARLKYRELFRRSLHRHFPGWRIAELSTEPDLQHSLSPSYPRALLRRGCSTIAAIGAAEDSLAPEGALSFGLIWLDYVRRRAPKHRVEGLAIFVPAAAQAVTCHRVRYLNSNAARFLVFVHHHGQEDAVDPADYANFETRIEPIRRAADPRGLESIAAIEGVERRERPDGSISLAVRGLEFARLTGREILCGIDHKERAASLDEVARLAAELARMRHPAAADRLNPLYLRQPEFWLESQVRAHLQQFDANLLLAPVYGQVPQFAAGGRTILDLLAADRHGRLAVIEIKADQDIHLPLQALDYWMRVVWHLDRGDFLDRGYFPDLALSPRAPKLMLIAPALAWHPANEIVLRYFSPRIEAERFGVALEWRKEPRVMFRTPVSPWP